MCANFQINVLATIPYPSKSTDQLLYVSPIVLTYCSKVCWLVGEKCAVGQSDSAGELRYDLHEIILHLTKKLHGKKDAPATEPPTKFFITFTFIP